jgi:hypothetical protein
MNGKAIWDLANNGKMFDMENKRASGQEEEKER